MVALTVYQDAYALLTRNPTPLVFSRRQDRTRPDGRAAVNQSNGPTLAEYYRKATVGVSLKGTNCHIMHWTLDTSVFNGATDYKNVGWKPLIQAVRISPRRLGQWALCAVP